MSGFTRTWYGNAPQWECDEVEHLNMRFYMAKVQQARQMFLIQMGLHDAFDKGAVSTVRVRQFHIRYVKEARSADQLYIETGISSFSDEQIDLVHLMYHRSGALAATVCETLDHIYLRTGARFRWPSRVREGWPNRQVDIPAEAQPRGLGSNSPPTDFTADRLIELGCEQTGLGVFLPSEADIFNYINVQQFLGRAADSGGNFAAGWPEQSTPDWGRIMGAILEGRLHIYRGAEPGHPVHVYSGLKSYDRKVRRIIHYLINPLTGDVYAALDSVVGLIDTEARRLADITKDNAAKLDKILIPELSL